MTNEYNRELSADLHTAWMAVQAIRAGIPHDGLGGFTAIDHGRWMKLADAMRVITELKAENFAFLEQQIDAMTAAIAAIKEDSTP